MRYVKHDNKIVRIGHPARVSIDAVNWTLDVLCSGKNHRRLSKKIREEIRKSNANLRKADSRSWKQLENDLLKKLESFTKKPISRSLIERVLKNANVIFSTLNG